MSSWGKNILTAPGFLLAISISNHHDLKPRAEQKLDGQGETKWGRKKSLMLTR